MDFVFTVCDHAAARWIAFRAAFKSLENRIKIFVSLPIGSLSRLRLQEGLEAIGRRSETETA
jgi:arsenate reductase (thioredoxin)